MRWLQSLVMRQTRTSRTARMSPLLSLPVRPHFYIERPKTKTARTLSKGPGGCYSVRDGEWEVVDYHQLWACQKAWALAQLP